MRVLLNTQRKKLHDMLVQNDIDPAITKWTNDRKGWTSSNVETLQAGLCHFLFHPENDGTFTLHLKPGVDGGATLGLVNQSWREVISLFDVWAKYVKRELIQEDPWQQYSAYLPPERLGKSTDNSPFTYKEAEHVSRSVTVLLEHIKKQLPNYNKVEDQFDPQFERLSKQAKDGAGRIDWSNQLVGMLISLCMALSLAPDAAAEIWQFWVSVIDGLTLP